MNELIVQEQSSPANEVQNRGGHLTVASATA
jgi:hypothetical protein